MHAVAIAVVSAVVLVSGIGAGAAADFPMTPREIFAGQDDHADIGVDLRLPPVNGLIPLIDQDLYAARCEQVRGEANADPRRVEMFCGVEPRVPGD